KAILGTLKAGVRLDTQTARLEGPFFKGWKVTAALRAPAGTTYVATASDVYGAAIHASEDLARWRQIEHGPAYSKESGRKLQQVWKLVSGPRGLWAGVDEAGAFASEDGERWEPVPGLNEHASRPRWVPGFGGLCAHAVLFDAT